VDNRTAAWGESHDGYLIGTYVGSVREKRRCGVDIDNPFAGRHLVDVIANPGIKLARHKTVDHQAGIPLTLEDGGRHGRPSHSIPIAAATVQ
jgi:hypothetical protein